MPLWACPCCHRMAGDLALCVCGCDLAELRTELARLMRPSIVWSGRVVFPFELFRLLSPTARRVLAEAIAHAADG